MLTQYHRPDTLEAALDLLARPDTIPLGGGSVINSPAFTAAYAADFAVVDLQALGLNHIQKKNNHLETGATVTLQQLLEDEHVPGALRRAIELESAINLRHVATLAGTLIACDGRSPFATAMLALDAHLAVSDGRSSRAIALGDFLPLRELPHRLATAVTLPLKAQLAFEHVARTPADRPIVCAALARWPSGRTRLALGGYGKAPLLAMDAPEAGGLETAARNAFYEAGDAWASAEYRAGVAAILAGRCLQKLSVA
ncbi:MAG: FAD binding domain-containing protein [Chloroflexota bacterium]